jgi:hypothetical protein
VEPVQPMSREIVGAAARHGALAASRMRRSAPAMMSRTWCTTSGFTEIDVIPRGMNSAAGPSASTGAQSEAE